MRSIAAAARAAAMEHKRLERPFERNDSVLGSLIPGSSPFSCRICAAQANKEDPAEAVVLSSHVRTRDSLDIRVVHNFSTYVDETAPSAQRLK